MNVMYIGIGVGVVMLCGGLGYMAYLIKTGKHKK